MKRIVGRKLVDFDPALVQPKPTPSDEDVLIYRLVMQDVETRAMAGKAKYGQFLKPNDGRDNLLDIYQELIDAAKYISKEIYRRDGQ